jgi:2',3'-cyclic-nucleotide 2'-phosphodiesterase
MRILFIGDIFGRPGRNIVKDRLPGMVRDQAIDLIIANGENSAAGFGITPALAEDLLDLNIDVITTGNHRLLSDG